MTTHLQRLEGELGVRYSPDTMRTYLKGARAFLRHAGEKPAYTREDVLTYIDSLITAGRRRNSILSAIVAIQALCRAIGCEWPIDKRGLHLPARDDGDEGTGPVLDPDEVRRLIQGVRRLEDNRAIRVTTMLATLYGFRVSEISRILDAGIAAPILAVTTSKSRKKREHVIPSAVWPAMQLAPHGYSPAKLHLIFRDLLGAHVRPARPGEGWHAVRRALVTGLAVNEVPDRLLVRFFGWSARGSSGELIVQRYTRMPYQEVDRQVFTKHPFLRYWVE